MKLALVRTTYVNRGRNMSRFRMLMSPVENPVYVTSYVTRCLCLFGAVLLGALVSSPVLALPMSAGWSVDDIVITGFGLEDFETGTGQ